MKLKRSILLICLILCIAALAACRRNPEREMGRGFLEHLQTVYASEEADEALQFTSRHLTFRGCDVDIEPKQHGTYRVIAYMGTVDDDQLFAISHDELKSEMNAFAEALITFAQQENFDNNYHLFVQINGSFEERLLGFVYDYEKDILYLPERYADYCTMYSLFGTTIEPAVAETDAGCTWLVEHGFGEVKHHIYEPFYKDCSPGVYLDIDDEFTPFFLEWYLDE